MAVNDYVYKWSGKEEDAKIIFGQLGLSGLDYLHVTEFEAWQPAFEGSKASLVSLAKKNIVSCRLLQMDNLIK